MLKPGCPDPHNAAKTFLGFTSNACSDWITVMHSLFDRKNVGSAMFKVDGMNGEYWGQSVQLEDGDPPLEVLLEQLRTIYPQWDDWQQRAAAKLRQAKKH